MKTTILSVAALVITLTANAQKIEVKEESQSFSSGTQNALTTTIYSNTKDDVEGAWKSLLKDFKNEKVKSDKGELFGDNILIKEWGNNTVDVYTKFEEDKKKKTVEMSVAFDLGGVYLKGSDDKYKFAEKMIRDFAIKMTKEPLELKVKEATKLVAKVEDEQKDLEKEKVKLQDNIADYKKKITDAENDIKKNDDSQTKKKAEIEATKKALEESKKILDSVN